MKQQTTRKPELTGALRRDSVKKHVGAIHVSGKLSLLQRKLSNVLLLNAYDTLTTSQSHSIDAKTLCLMVGYNSNDVATLRGALKSLAETVAEWDMLDEDGKQEWGVSALLSYAKLREGVCEYAYSPVLAQKLHDPKMFALINVNIQRNFSSGHGLALYENCYRFVRTGSTGWWSLDLFRKFMGVEESAYYASFKHLNAKIIKPAVTEVNKTSNITITPEFAKKGRAVTEVRFLIRENPQLAMFDIDDSDGLRKSSLYERLRGQGVSDRLARQWISEHGEEYIAEKLAYVAGKNGVKSTLGYLSAAIRKDYVKETPPKPSPEAVAVVAERAQASRDIEQQEDTRIAARLARQARFAVVRGLIEARNPTQRDADKRLFVATLEDELAREDFRNRGWESALNAQAIFDFWCELEPEAFEG
ncbi:MAG: replication initiation protein [Rhodobacteraceae bacterium]|nr:replication initiation protein [Paracoccaceae bacterium]